MRYALYYTPPRDHALTRLASAWLGRDAFTGLTVARAEQAGLALGELAYFTAPPRRYGFHATLKAPFRLAPGFAEDELIAAVESFCGQVAPVAVPRLEIGRLGGFFALVSAERSAELDTFASRVVAEFDRFRAPLTEAEIERRNPVSLTTVQLRNLRNWGYPYVFGEFRFHMTLTGEIGTGDRPRVQAALERQFGPVLGGPLDIGHLAVFVEREPGAPFEVHSIHEVGRAARRRTG